MFKKDKIFKFYKKAWKILPKNAGYGKIKNKKDIFRTCDFFTKDKMDMFLLFLWIHAFYLPRISWAFTFILQEKMFQENPKVPASEQNGTDVKKRFTKRDNWNAYLDFGSFLLFQFNFSETFFIFHDMFFHKNPKFTVCGAAIVFCYITKSLHQVNLTSKGKFNYICIHILPPCIRTTLL